MTRIGFNQAELSQWVTADITKLYQGLQAVGATAVRLEADWQLIETSPGVYNPTALSFLDNAINPAAAYGVAPLVMLSCGIQSPTWATPEAYAAFCTAIVKRYPSVTTWEISNEMNSLNFWNPVSPTTYVAYLKAAYTAIHVAQPAATVISGGIAADVTWLTLTIDSVDYLRQMYAAGAHAFMDAVGYHPYAISASTFVAQEPTMSEQFMADIPAMYALMQAHGDGALKIWPTEIGFPTTQVTPAVQAQWLIEQLTNLKTFAYLGPVFIYNYRDSGTDAATNANDAMGVVQNNWTPKPALAAIQAFIGTPPVVTPPVVTPPVVTPPPVNPLQAFLNAIAAALKAFFSKL